MQVSKISSSYIAPDGCVASTIDASQKRFKSRKVYSTINTCSIRNKLLFLDPFFDSVTDLAYFYVCRFVFIFIIMINRTHRPNPGYQIVVEQQHEHTKKKSELRDNRD